MNTFLLLLKFHQASLIMVKWWHYLWVDKYVSQCHLHRYRYIQDMSFLQPFYCWLLSFDHDQNYTWKYHKYSNWQWVLSGSVILTPDQVVAPGKCWLSSLWRSQAPGGAGVVEGEAGDVTTHCHRHQSIRRPDQWRWPGLVLVLAAARFSWPPSSGAAHTGHLVTVTRPVTTLAMLCSEQLQTMQWLHLVIT